MPKKYPRCCDTLSIGTFDTGIQPEVSGKRKVPFLNQKFGFWASVKAPASTEVTLFTVTELLAFDQWYFNLSRNMLQSIIQDPGHKPLTPCSLAGGFAATEP